MKALLLRNEPFRANGTNFLIFDAPGPMVLTAIDSRKPLEGRDIRNETNYAQGASFGSEKSNICLH
jgi:hypothetical protein